jgi:hypothetical protein
LEDEKKERRKGDRDRGRKGEGREGGKEGRAGEWKDGERERKKNDGKTGYGIATELTYFNFIKFFTLLSFLEIYFDSLLSLSG